MGWSLASQWGSHGGPLHRRVLAAIARFVIWDRIASLQPYLDPAVGPSAAALLFFEHLLKPSLAEARAQLLAHRARQPSADFVV